MTCAYQQPLKSGHLTEDTSVMPTFWRRLSAILLLIIFTTGCEPADLPFAGKTDSDRPTEASHIPGDNVITVGNVRVLKEERQVEVDANVVLREGILEYLAVAEGGKEYESVLSLRCKPSQLHAALLLLGCETGGVPQQAKGDYIGPSMKRRHENPRSRLDVFVEWQVAGRTVRVRAEKLLTVRTAGGASPGDTYWVFTGSLFDKDDSGRELYLADLERSVIAVWYDPSALINLPIPSADPYRGNTYGFRVNTKILPESSKVKLILQPHR